MSECRGRMENARGWIAVDWGTTNRRAFALDAAGREVDRLRDARGIRSVERGSFPAAVGALRARFGDLPILLAGMVGSNRGWVEAPYVPCPATLDGLVGRLVRIDDEDAWIIPGVCHVAEDRHDVMRGEEVQLFGAVAAGLTPPDGLACHPGTHAKWARMEAGAVTGFRTVMTGEMFALLKAHSILAPQLAPVAAIGPSFLEGVDRSLTACDLLADLFSVRARALLAGLTPEAASAFTSGLLIGADVKIGLAGTAEDVPVTLVGDGNLTALYAAALERAGRRATRVDGEVAFLAGIAAIAEKIA